MIEKIKIATKPNGNLLTMRSEAMNKYWAPKNGQIVKNVCDTARDRQDKSSSAPAGYGLDQRMKDAGMMPVSEMLEHSSLGWFSAHAGINNLESFEQWIQMKREEFIKMQAQMTLDGLENDELFEWVVAHNAVLGEVIANFRQATGRNP